MKLLDIYTAFNTLISLSDAILDAKLGIKINRISRELKDEALNYENADKKIAENFALELEKKALELGGKKMCADGQNYYFDFKDKEGKEDKNAKNEYGLFVLEQSKQRQLQQKELQESDHPIKTNFTKITLQEIEGAKFRDNHKFSMSLLRFIEDFTTESND